MLKRLIIFALLACSLPILLQGDEARLSHTRLKQIQDAQLRMRFSKDNSLKKTLCILQENRFECQVDTIEARTAYETIKEELKPCLEISFLNPEISDWFDIYQSGDTLRGIRKSAFENKSRLLEQVLIMNPKKGLVRKIKTHLHRDNWLYREDIEVSVFFNGSGLYQGHVLKAITEVKLSGGYIVLVSGVKG